MSTTPNGMRLVDRACAWPRAPGRCRGSCSAPCLRPGRGLFSLASPWRLAWRGDVDSRCGGGRGADRLDGRVRVGTQSGPARVVVEAVRRLVQDSADPFDRARVRVGRVGGISRRRGRSSGVQVHAPLGEPGGACQMLLGRLRCFDWRSGVVGCVELLVVAVQVVDLSCEGFSFLPVRYPPARASRSCCASCGTPCVTRGVRP